MKREDRLADPLIDEVRERRRRLFAEHGSDLQRLCEAIRRLEDEHPEKVGHPRERERRPR